MNDISKSLSDYIIELAHIGHIVPDLEAAIANFKKVYGVTDEDIEVLPNPPDVEVMTKFAFVTVCGTNFELIEPVSDHFKDMLLNMPSGLGGINHVAYYVKNIEGAIATLANQGIYPGHVTPDGIVNFGTRKMCYMNPETTENILIELIENVDVGQD